MMVLDRDSFIEEFLSLDIITSEQLKFGLQTHWKIQNNVVDTLDIVLVCGQSVWKGFVNRCNLEENAQTLNLEFDDYCHSLKYAFGSAIGPKNDLLNFKDGVLKWQKILKIGFYISYGDFTFKLVPDSSILAKTICSLSNNNHMLNEKLNDVLECNSNIQRGWDALKTQTEEMIKIKEQMEKELYDRFIAILNEKKIKICKLKERIVQLNSL